MSNETTQVAIIMGSDSDLPIVEAIFPILDSFEVKYTKNVMSAHRTPHAVMELIKNSENNGCKVFIAAAGMAAHLAGAIAAQTTKPVLGIPLGGGDLDGMDALLATVQMPKGVPVATFAIGKSGAINAALCAVQILGTTDEKVAGMLIEYKSKMHDDVLAANESIQ